MKATSNDEAVQRYLRMKEEKENKIQASIMVEVLFSN